MPIRYAEEVFRHRSGRLPLAAQSQTEIESRLCAPLGLGDYRARTIDTFQCRTHSLINNRLPIEILEEIFDLCVKEDTALHSIATISFSLYQQSGSPYAEPEVLAQVCRHWRQVAVSMTSLWFIVHVTQPAKWPVARVKLWLERSKDHELSLKLYDPRFLRKNGGEPIINEILSLFIGETHRWRDIHFRLQPTAHPMLASIPSGAATALQLAIAYFCPPYDGDTRNADSFWQAIFSAPSLRRVNWSPSNTDQTPSHLPWAKLSHITLQFDIPHEVVYCILAECKDNLVEFRARDICFVDQRDDDLPESQQTLILPNLRILRIGGNTSLMPLLRRLTLPALTCLWLICISWRASPRQYLALRDFLLRSSCRLEELHITNWGMDENDVMECLAVPQLSSLTRLELGVMRTEKLTTMLTPIPGEESHIFPQLQTLFFNASYAASSGSISSMVVSRLATLNSAFIFLDRTACTRDLAAFEAIIQDYPWLDVVVTDAPILDIEF